MTQDLAHRWKHDGVCFVPANEFIEPAEWPEHTAWVDPTHPAEPA